MRNPYATTPKGAIRCKKCRQVGHKAFRCPNKPGPPKCQLCGQPGHLSPRCPNKICTMVSVFSVCYSTWFPKFIVLTEFLGHLYN